MASSVGPARNGRPAAACAYTKERLGWLTYEEITANGDYTLRTSNRYPDALVIRQGFAAADEYLLLEYRQAVDDDADLFGGGLLIYHVDESKMLQGVGGHPWQTIDGGWPANGRHYRVALLPADGNYDLERGLNNGDAGDFWTTGRTLGPSHGNNGQQQPVYPNTDSYQNRTNIYPTNISITVLEQSGEQITIRVAGMATDPLSSPSPTTSTSTPILQPTIAQPATPPPPTPTAPSFGQAPSPPTSAPSLLATPTTITASPTLLRRPSSEPSGSPPTTTTTSPYGGSQHPQPGHHHGSAETKSIHVSAHNHAGAIIHTTSGGNGRAAAQCPTTGAEPRSDECAHPPRREHLGMHLVQGCRHLYYHHHHHHRAQHPPHHHPSPSPQPQPSTVGREEDEGSSGTGSSPPSSSAAAASHTRRRPVDHNIIALDTDDDSHAGAFVSDRRRSLTLRDMK